MSCRQFRLAGLGFLHPCFRIRLVWFQGTGFGKFIDGPIPLFALEVDVTVFHELVVLLIDFRVIGQRSLQFTLGLVSFLDDVRLIGKEVQGRIVKIHGLLPFSARF